MNIVTQLSRVWRQEIFILIALSFCFSTACSHHKEVAMESVFRFYIDREPVSLTPEPLVKNGEVLVPLHAFSHVLGAEVETIEAGARFAVCKGDICVPLDVSGGNIISIAETVYAPISVVAEPLGLRWQIENNILNVTSSAVVLNANKELRPKVSKVESIGLSIGSRPPDFTLSDIYTGELVSTKDYLGKKTVFFMWASW